MHTSQLNLMASNEKRLCALEEKVKDLLGMIQDLDENYDKLYKWMMEKSKVIQKI